MTLSHILLGRQLTQLPANCYNKGMHGLTIFTARYLLFLMPLLPLYVLLHLKRPAQRRLVYQAILATVLAFILAKVATQLISSPRPFIADGVTPFFTSARDNGFPSDHTLMAGLVAFTTLLYSRRLGLVALVLAVLVGSARVVSGVHHGIDIIGGLVLSGLGVYAINYFFSRYYRSSKTAPAHND